MKVLQCFKEYLPVTVNWAYRLLANTSDINIVITANKFLKTNFYNDRFSYIDYAVNMPVRHRDEETLKWKGIYFALRKLLSQKENYIIGQAKNVDIVHSHFAPTAWQFRNIANRLKVPHIISFYGYDYEQLPESNPVWAERYKQMFEEASVFICEGWHGAGILKRKGCPEHKIRVVRLGVEPDKIPVFQRTKMEGELSLIQIASFREKKVI